MRKKALATEKREITALFRPPDETEDGIALKAESDTANAALTDAFGAFDVTALEQLETAFADAELAHHMAVKVGVRTAKPARDVLANWIYDAPDKQAKRIRQGIGFMLTGVIISPLSRL